MNAEESLMRGTALTPLPPRLRFTRGAFGRWSWFAYLEADFMTRGPWSVYGSRERAVRVGTQRVLRWQERQAANRAMGVEIPLTPTAPPTTTPLGGDS